MLEVENFELKNSSWVKIGGKAKKYIEVENSEDLKLLASKLIKDNQQWDIFGWGANTLFSDEDFNSTIIKVKTNESKILNDFHPDSNIVFPEIIDTHRHVTFKNEKITSGFDTSDLNYSEPDAKDIYVWISAGVSLPFLINDLISKGITGLSMFAGIPGTVGGAVYNNIHGGERLFSEFIYSVDVIDSSGVELTLTRDQLNLSYNHSVLQTSKFMIIGATLKLKLGDLNRARNVAIEWTKRKSSQPKNSLGSVFHNLTSEQQNKFELPTPGMAYLIEHKLKLSGYRIGGIQIPEQYPPEHVQINKNIFMNVGNGTASDFIAVMRKVSDEVFLQFGFRPKAEIFFKGFDEEEISIFK